jgi:hypothetical protein
MIAKPPGATLTFGARVMSVCGRGVAVGCGVADGSTVGVDATPSVSLDDGVAFDDDVGGGAVVVVGAQAMISRTPARNVRTERR